MNMYEHISYMIIYVFMDIYVYLYIFIHNSCIYSCMKNFLPGHFKLLLLLNLVQILCTNCKFICVNVNALLLSNYKNIIKKIGSFDDHFLH